MITYGPGDIRAAPNLPPVCPTCGSHRTEVTGTTEDGGLAVCSDLRGERPRVVVPLLAPGGVDVDDVTAEFAVMRAVGNLLAQLPGAESRTRVLHWAADRFQSGRAAGSGSASSADSAVASTESFRLFMEPDQDAASSAEFAAPSTRKVDDPGLTLDGFDPFAELSMAAVALEWPRA